MYKISDFSPEALHATIQ